MENNKKNKIEAKSLSEEEEEEVHFIWRSRMKDASRGDIIPSLLIDSWFGLNRRPIALRNPPSCWFPCRNWNLFTIFRNSLLPHPCPVSPCSFLHRAGLLPTYPRRIHTRTNVKSAVRFIFSLDASDGCLDLKWIDGWCPSFILYLICRQSFPFPWNSDS